MKNTIIVADNTYTLSKGITLKGSTRLILKGNNINTPNINVSLDIEGARIPKNHIIVSYSASKMVLKELQAANILGGTLKYVVLGLNQLPIVPLKINLEDLPSLTA